MKKDYNFHVSGFKFDGTRVSRYYKTYNGAQKMIKQMHWVNCTYLKTVDLCAFKAASINRFPE